MRYNPYLQSFAFHKSKKAQQAQKATRAPVMPSTVMSVFPSISFQGIPSPPHIQLSVLSSNGNNWIKENQQLIGLSEDKGHTEP